MTAELLRHALVATAGDLAAASPRERAARVQELARSAGVTVQTVYRALAKAGVRSGRTRRADAGVSSVTQEELEALAAIMATGRNKRGQANVPLREAIEIARAQGMLRAEVSYEQLCRRMREAGLDRRRMLAPEPAIARVSQHPNHVWELDISVAIQWYFRDEEGKRLDQYADAGARYYSGKVENFRKLTRVIHRYVIVDHYTGAYWVQYRYTPGESALDAVDFLWSAMAPKEGDRMPMHGIPRRIVADQGPAFKSQVIQQLLSDLGCDLELHARGNAKASGGVETRHNHWQRSFEGRLALRPARDLDELNRWAALACAKMNEEREHTRHGQTPSRLWLTIRPEQLREPPDQATFLALASSQTRKATLTNQCWLRAKGRRWLITGEGVYPRQKVQYRLHPFLDSGIRVWDDLDRELVATPLTFDDAGFPENGNRHVWDDETAKGYTMTPPPAQVAARVRAEEPLRIDGVFDDLIELEQIDIGAKRRGAPFVPAAGRSAADIRELDSLTAREEAARRLGRALSRDEARWWRQAVPEAGLTRRELDELWTAFTTSVATATG